MDKHYSVIFRGDVVTGSDLEEVKSKLAVLLKEDASNIDKLFSGQTYVIKRKGDLPTCEKIRRAFIGAGAVCHIQETDNAAGADKTGDDDTLKVLDSTGTSKHASHKKTRRDWKNSLVQLKETMLSGKKLLAMAQTKSVALWRDGSESIQSDIEMGGAKSLLTNKFVTLPVGAIFFILVLLVAGFTYDNETMPVTEANLDKILNHIEFIESAFTNEELETMTRNRSDFLDYVLVDPIRKMGYEFEPSIEKICDDFLDGDFSTTEEEKVNVILKLTTHEREELLKHGIISESMKNKLEKVAKVLQSQ